MRWSYSPLDGTGERYAFAAWVICFNCGFSLHIDVRAKMAQFHLTDPFDMKARLSCPCCNLRQARILTLRVNGRGEERWKVLTHRAEPVPPPPEPDRLKFLIERQKNSIFGQMCARLDNDIAGRAAFKRETERHPDVPLILRVGGHVLATHKWPAGG
jgi:hypothetical protein